MTTIDMHVTNSDVQPSEVKDRRKVMRPKTMGLVSFAAAYLAGLVGQCVAFPVRFFTGTDQAHSIFDKFYTDSSPPPPNCRCIEGHHDPILFSWRGETFQGWLHASQVEDWSNKTNPFPYYIEVDPSYPSLREFAYTVKSTLIRNKSFDVPTGPVEGVSQLKADFTVLQPYKSMDGRYFFVIVGSPFKPAQPSRQEYDRSRQEVAETWTSLIQGAFAEKEYGASLSKVPQITYGNLNGRVFADLFLSPVMAAVPIGLAALTIQRQRRA